MQDKKVNSSLVQNDALTENTYLRNNFDPAEEISRFSYTSGRVAKRCYNTYRESDNESFSVFGYYTDWSQYDGRLDNPNAANDDLGRGIDLSLLKPDAYDKLIIGFLGVVGDQGEKKETIEKAATCDFWPNSLSDYAGFCKGDFNVVFVDPWGDVLSYRNCGFTGWKTNDVSSMYWQDQAQGVLGGLRKLKKNNPKLRLGMSIGGWTMSDIFHSLTRAPEKRKIFNDSLIDILERFPMFTDIDIDWEYPGMTGNNNPNAPDDAHYFQILIKELRELLDNRGFGNIKISIATNAGLQGLAMADIPGMIASGVEGINLMTYDFFGTPWAENLAHHTNLYDYGDMEHHSIDKAVDYLEAQGVDLKKVYIGYAAYSRSARNTDITNFSPLVGGYSPGTDTTTGSFESGVTEWYDIIYNYLDLENRQGRNGFELYTDEQAEADYLYSQSSKLFMSIDTPRTVKAKGEYVRERGLGGLFTWTVDMDNGILVNAAREGLGYKTVTQVVDMDPFYFKGINTEASQDPVAIVDGKTEITLGEMISLSGERSLNSIQYVWSAPDFAFHCSTEPRVTALADKVGSFTVTLTVQSEQGKQDSKTINVNVKDRNDDIPYWKPQDYPQAGIKVKHNYQQQGVKIYQNNWYANSTEEPGDPQYTGGPNTGKVWTEIS